MKRYTIITLMIGVTSTISACHDFLDAKPDKKLVVPTTISDYWTLMDNSNIMNRVGAWAGEASSDDYFITTDVYNSTNEYRRNMYLWKSPAISDALPNDWSTVYNAVYYSNLVLDGLSTIKPHAEEKIDYECLKGAALFFRAKYFFDALTIWALAYDKRTATQQLGVPLRLTADINIKSKRSSLRESYDRVINDLRESIGLLPIISANAMRPSKPAAYGMLSRVYMAMGNYVDAGRYADSCLQFRNDLINYSLLDASQPYPIARFNKEVIIHFNMELRYDYRIDTALYTSYDVHDLRKLLFFQKLGDGYFTFRGSYDGSSSLFTGISTNEMYLNSAECLARSGNVEAAMNRLNRFRENRYNGDEYIDPDNVTATDLLNLVLEERRKELLLRGIRWIDLKRLNKEENRKVTLKRVINNVEYVLEPNSPSYAILIPESIIRITNMEQNPR